MPSYDEATYDLLVGYALDILEPSDLTAVDRLLDQQPELRQTAAELRRTVQLIAYSVAPATPPADLRQRTLDYVTRPTPRSPRPAAPSQRSRSRWGTLFAGLSALLLLVATLGWLQWNTLRHDIAQLRIDVQQNQAHYHDLVVSVAQAESLVQLTGERGDGTLIQRSSTTALLIAQLPTLPADRVYQVWSITGDNAPMSIGTLQIDSNGYGSLELATDTIITADVVAITDEPAPGSVAPTTDPLLKGQL